MDSTDIFNYLFESFNRNRIKYVILHSYKNFPDKFNSDIDVAIDVPKITDAIELLDQTLQGTGWKVVQYWRHENYAVDCVISNAKEYLQVDFCTNYERNGRLVIPVEELLEGRQLYRNFYIPSVRAEFRYILLKKILKRFFSEESKKQLTLLWMQMTLDDRIKTKEVLSYFFGKNSIEKILKCIEIEEFNTINLEKVYKELKCRTFDFKDNLHYRIFDIKRKIERIFHPTGLFIVLLGVDGAGKTTIAEELERRYVTAFRRIKHYHSRVRVLKDLSQIKPGSRPINASNPHGKKERSGKVVSLAKFVYYFVDFFIGNIVISIDKIKSTLILIERYYYDYTIDKVRYNLNLSDRFINFFGHFVKKPDAIFVLTGDSKILLGRKKEITVDEIDMQIKRLEKRFLMNPQVTFIDTTRKTVDECVDQMLFICNQIMRERRKWI